jgi:hypothetical protein
MRSHRLLLSSFAVLAVSGTAGCGDNSMSMSEEIDRLASHQAALELELYGHHRDVLDAGETLRVRSFESGFGRNAATHMDEMDHRMRDMEDMCSMGGRRFDGGSMSDAMRRIREGIADHQRRMDALPDLASMHLEEGAFRDRMGSPMAEMRGRQSDARSSAAGYGCRMHGH